jgi:hypothetical protein
MERNKTKNIENIENCEKNEKEVENNLTEELHKLQNQNKKNTIKIKFADKLMIISNNIKNENSIYKDLYKEYLNNWKMLCVLKRNQSLYTLIEYLMKDNIYNIRKTIIGLITDDNLENELYFQFVEAFVNL